MSSSTASNAAPITVSPSPFASVPGGIADPILGLTELFRADTDSRKVNLGVGVYQDKFGKSGILPVVQKAEKQLLDREDTKSYLPIDGLAAYNLAVQKLLFGGQASGGQGETVSSGRAVTVQSVGGSGALKVGADFIRRTLDLRSLVLSDPSWENHRSLFEAAGFDVTTYPYYDSTTNGVKFPQLLEALKALPKHTVVLLHACCHNPTGVDLTNAEWDGVIDVLVSRDLLPFLDLAYQGFGAGLEEDVYPIRRLAMTGHCFLVASSFSKSFSLYRERVGALTVVTASKEEAGRVTSQLKRVVRTIYSSPPAHGAQIVATVLDSPELRSEWETDLTGMRERIKGIRRQFVAELRQRIPNRDFSFIEHQRGMFSYSGLSVEVVRRLREEFHIYALDSGRICVAAMNEKNVGYICESLASILS